MCWRAGNVLVLQYERQLQLRAYSSLLLLILLGRVCGFTATAVEGRREDAAACFFEKTYSFGRMSVCQPTNQTINSGRRVPSVCLAIHAFYRFPGLSDRTLPLAYGILNASSPLQAGVFWAIKSWNCAPPTKTDIFSALYNIKLWNKNCLKENKILHE